MAGRLNVQGTVTIGDDTYTGKIVTFRGTLAVRHGKNVLLERQYTALDRISGKVYHATLDDGELAVLATAGCGCGK